MAFLNFLSDVGAALNGSNAQPNPMLSLAGYQDPNKDALNQMVTSPGVMPQAPQRRGGLRNILGILGDALLVGNDMHPVYREQQQRARIGQALANYLGNTDQALAEIFQQDPQTGIELYKVMHPQNEVPAAIKEFQAYQNLPPEQRPAFERYLQLTHPGFGAPLTIPGNAEIQMPGVGGNAPTVTTQEQYDALAPGTEYIDSAGNHARKAGGAGQAGPRTFP